MTHRARRLAIVGGVMSLAGCILVSDAKVIQRIKAALPYGAVVEVHEIETQLSCIGATFTLAMPSEPVAFNSGGFGSKSGMGVVWHRVANFDDFERIPRGLARSVGVQHAWAFGTGCLRETAFEVDRLWRQEVAITTSDSGEEMIVVFPKATPIFGVYMAGD